MPAWPWTRRYEPSGLKRTRLSARSGGLSRLDEITSTGWATGSPVEEANAERCLGHHGCRGRGKPAENRERRALANRTGTRQTRRVLIGLLPELDAPGGVQRAGRHLAAVMTEFAGSRGVEWRLRGLHD